MSEVSRYNINIHQGETWSMTLTILDNNDNPKNLTDYTGKLQIRGKPGGTLLKELSTAVGGGMTINGAYGEIVLEMTAASTGALMFKNAQYDLFIYSAAGTSTPLLRGEVKLTQRVTQ